MSEAVSVYLAAPYTVNGDGTEEEKSKKKQERVDAINVVAGQLMKEGLIVFSPITHSHPIAVSQDMPGTWEFWQEQDVYWLDKCDKLVVLQLPGWKESVGVKAEIAYAEEHDKEVIYIDLD